MTHKKPIVAAIQMCSSGDVNENLQTAARLISIAANHGAELVVLPEMFAVMEDKAKVAVKEPMGKGKIQDFLAREAKENRVWLVGGTIPIASPHSSKFSAASLVFDDHGKNVARYDKIHMFDVELSDKEIYQESLLIEPGKKTVVVDTPLGKLGLAVCYDVRFPEQFREMIKKGAEMIALPSAFTMKTGKAHFELLIRSRAIDNFCYMIGACQGGTHANGRKTYGNSMIVGPWGDVLARANGDEIGVIYATIDIDKVYAARKTIPVLDF